MSLLWKSRKWQSSHILNVYSWMISETGGKGWSLKAFLWLYIFTAEQKPAVLKPVGFFPASTGVCWACVADRIAERRSQQQARISAQLLLVWLTARLRILLRHLHGHLATRTKWISGYKHWLIMIHWKLIAWWLQWYRDFSLQEKSFSNQFGILELPKTLIAPEKPYGAVLCFLFGCFF